MAEPLRLTLTISHDADGWFSVSVPDSDGTPYQGTASRDLWRAVSMSLNCVADIAQEHFDKAAPQRKGES